MNRLFLFALCLTFLLATAATAAESSDQGQQVYQKTCSACHDSGLAGAPKFGDEEAWEERLEKGMDTLVNMRSTASRAMPASCRPRGATRR